MKDKNLNTYYGDIHNHCGASYGHGPVEDDGDHVEPGAELELGLPDALTGPVARGDVETVRRHLDALADTESENWVWKGANCLEPEYRHCMI